MKLPIVLAILWAVLGIVIWLGTGNTTLAMIDIAIANVWAATLYK